MCKTPTAAKATQRTKTEKQCVGLFFRDQASTNFSPNNRSNSLDFHAAGFVVEVDGENLKVVYFHPFELKMVWASRSTSEVVLFDYSDSEQKRYEWLVLRKQLEWLYVSDVDLTDGEREQIQA